jgi:hypothetical protein
MDSLLANDYPDVTFIGVDVNTDTVEKNADLKKSNLVIRSGYALDMLEEGNLSPDLVYLSSTATVIRNEELRRYLRAFLVRTKYVLFSEPIWPLPGDIVVNPRDVPADNSTPGYVQRDPLTSTYGYLCWNHNYAGLLENAGFQLVEYRFYRPSFTNLYWSLAFGQNSNSSLWKT